MNNIKAILKNNGRLIIGILVGLMLYTSVYAATIYYDGINVGYDNTTSGLISDNVQDVLDELNNGIRKATFNVNGGSGYIPDPLIVRKGCPMPRITSFPTKSGYTFMGWYDDADYTHGTQYYTTEGVSAKNYDKNTDVTLYAAWSRTTYTMTYNNNGGSGCTTKVGEAESTWGTLCTPTRSGYAFQRWNTNSSGTGTTYTSSSTVSGNVTVYAIWLQKDSTSKSFAYTGGVQTYVAPSTGTYKLEVWGAQGGSPMCSGITSKKGGYGGYATGTMTLSEGQIVYVYVGGAGSWSHGTSSNNPAPGGWNGGGTGSTATNYAGLYGSGGGATHMASVNVSGHDPISSTNISNIYLIAGGGGGAASYAGEKLDGTNNIWFFQGDGGYGGGSSGSAGQEETRDGVHRANPGYGGTGSAGGAAGTGGAAGVYGKGGNGGSGGGGAGGGGYYGGGSGGSNAVGGGGASGYLNPSILNNRAWNSNVWGTTTSGSSNNGKAQITKQ